MSLAPELERGRAARGIETDAMCIAATVLVPVLEEIRPTVVEWGKRKIPVPFRWILGWIVGSVVDGLIEGLKEWRGKQCESS